MQSLKKELSFYDFISHESSKGEIQVKFREDITLTRFLDIEFGGNKDDFLEQAALLKKLFKSILNFYKTQEIILCKYNYRWVTNIEENLEMYNLFKTRKIRINFSGGFVVRNPKIIEQFFDANLKSCTFTYFIIPNEKIIIAPTDHMDMFIMSENSKELKRILMNLKEELDEFNMLRLVSG